MRKLYISLILTFIVSASITGCDDKTENDYIYNFKVISSGGNFTGYYFADADTPTAFTGALMSGSTDTYLFESPVDPDDSITVAADGEANGASSITIYLFKDGAKIKTVTATPTVTDGAVHALLEHSLSEETTSSK